jgi:hypothetical protein
MCIRASLLAVCASQLFAVASASSCVVTNQPINTPMSWGSQQVFSCSVPGNFKHDITVRNSAGNKLDVIATYGEYCSFQYINGPPVQSFSSYSTFAGSKSSVITFTGAPCETAPCCYIVACSENIKGSCTGSITVTSQFYDPNAGPTTDPTPLPDNGATTTSSVEAGTVSGSVIGCLAVAGAGAALWMRRRGRSYAFRPAAAVPAAYASLPLSADAVEPTGYQAAASSGP